MQPTTWRMKYYGLETILLPNNPFIGLIVGAAAPWRTWAPEFEWPCGDRLCCFIWTTVQWQEEQQDRKGGSGDPSTRAHVVARVGGEIGK
jgi:hypothetical protein